MNRIKLNSSICQIPLPIENSSRVHDAVMMLVQIRPVWIYNDGERTDEVGSYVYECVDLFSFDRIAIKVEGKKPLIDPDELIERREAGEKFYIEIIEGTVTAYYSERTNSIEDSFKAKAIEFVKEPNVQ